MLRKRKLSTLPTHGNKRRKEDYTVQEIKFDPSAREDYLTGFHKRKLQRIKHAKEEAIKKEREAKIEARRVLRDGRKADLEKHVQAIDSMVAKSHEFGSAGETTVDLEPWAGIEDVEMVDHEEEYVDEDRFTTVTVEAVNVSRDGLCKVMPDEEGSDDSNNVGLDNTSTTEGAREVQRGKPRWTKEKPHGVKKKKRKFKYETKEARKVTRRKQRLGKNTKAIARRK